MLLALPGPWHTSHFIDSAAPPAAPDDDDVLVLPAPPPPLDRFVRLTRLGRPMLSRRPPRAPPRAGFAPGAFWLSAGADADARADWGREVEGGAEVLGLIFSGGVAWVTIGEVSGVLVVSASQLVDGRGGSMLSFGT